MESILIYFDESDFLTYFFLGRVIYKSNNSNYYLPFIYPFFLSHKPFIKFSPLYITHVSCFPLFESVNPWSFFHCRMSTFFKYLPNPLTRAECDRRSICFWQSLTGFNSQFPFSATGCHTNGEDTSLAYP